MAENSKIEWCDHTVNPWVGCTKVSPGCANCYAEQLMDKRYGKVKWGHGNPRVRTSAANWRLPLKWNRAEEAVMVDHAGFVNPERPRVFCASLADVGDPEVPLPWFNDLMVLVDKCRQLDFLMLTKRPKDFLGRWLQVCNHWGRRADVSLPPNVWVGASVEDQKRADERIPELLKIPAKIRFLSCEPLLGPVDLRLAMPCGYYCSEEHGHVDHGLMGCIHWVICGGESGPNARPMHPDWARSLRDQCSADGVPFFMKQMGGARKPFPEIPTELNIREFPAQEVK